MGRWPGEWPEHLETCAERQAIHEACHYYLRGVSTDSYGMMEGDDEGKYVELYLDPEVRQAFISTGEGSVATGSDAASASETAVLKVYAAAKTAVIKRDTVLLTKEEVSRLSREGSAAILE